MALIQIWCDIATINYTGRHANQGEENNIIIVASHSWSKTWWADIPEIFRNLLKKIMHALFEMCIIYPSTSCSLQSMIELMFLLCASAWWINIHFSLFSHFFYLHDCRYNLPCIWYTGSHTGHCINAELI